MKHLIGNGGEIGLELVETPGYLDEADLVNKRLMHPGFHGIDQGMGNDGSRWGQIMLANGCNGMAEHGPGPV